mgnify:CR=1 FL=1
MNAWLCVYECVREHLRDVRACAVAHSARWWWRSFLCGGSTGIFIYGYAIYYYYARSYMYGLMQVSARRMLSGPRCALSG